MNDALVYLILVIAAAALVPLVSAFLRDRDYKRQIAGKKPMRTLKNGKHCPEYLGDERQENHFQEDILRYEGEIRAKSQIMQRMNLH